MEKSIIYALILASIIYLLAICYMIYDYGAPVSSELTLNGGLYFDEHGEPVVAPDIQLPKSMLHMAWKPDYIFAQQFRNAVNTFASNTFGLAGYVATLTAAFLALCKAWPFIRKVFAR